MTALKPGMATAIGSLPHKDMEAALELVLKSLPHCPHWPQLQSLRYTEGMEIQPVEKLPGIRHVPEKKSVYVDTEAGQDELAEFYEKAMAAQNGEGLDYFAIGPDYGQGIYAFADKLASAGARFPLVKAQLIAPFSFGYSIKDQDGRPIIFHPTWGDVCMKLLALKSIWQVKKLKSFAEKILYFLDEPMLSAYGGTAMLTVSRDDVLDKLNQVIDPLREAGAIVGMHCCGNTDWGLVMESSLDVINFDCYNYGKTVALYADQVKSFLGRGGWFAVGIVPTIFPDLETIDREDEKSLGKLFHQWLDEMAQAGVDKDLLKSRVILTPACGCGTLTIEQTEKVYRVVSYLSERYK